MHIHDLNQSYIMAMRDFFLLLSAFDQQPAALAAFAGIAGLGMMMFVLPKGYRTGQSIIYS